MFRGDIINAIWYNFFVHLIQRAPLRAGEGGMRIEDENHAPLSRGGGEWDSKVRIVRLFAGEEEGGMKVSWKIVIYILK